MSNEKRIEIQKARNYSDLFEEHGLPLAVRLGYLSATQERKTFSLIKKTVPVITNSLTGRQRGFLQKVV